MATKLKQLASTVHDMAQKGFGKGTNELYDKARPSFPHTAIDKIWQALPTRSAPLNIVECAPFILHLLICPDETPGCGCAS